MPPTLPAGPYQELTSPDNVSIPYYLLPFDKNGVCEGPETKEHLLSHLEGVTDIFVFSHGWNNDWTAATERYESFIRGMWSLREKHELPLPNPYAPLLVGIFWPSQSMEWFDSEAGPRFAAATIELETALRDMASELPADKRARFRELTQSTELAKGEDVELASLLAAILAGTGDDEAGTQPAPAARDLLAAAASIETPEPDYDDIGTATGDDPERGPAAAFGIGDAFRVLDPRNLVKPFTVWQMKNRAGDVGAKGVAPLLEALLTKSGESTRIHLLGHSFGCKVMMTATCVMPEPPRPIESALLLQAAVSQFAFAENVPERNVPGGFRKALSRVRRPIMTTYSHYDVPLSETFHLFVRRADDVGELQYAAEAPSKFGALGGFGPQATTFSKVFIRDPDERYELSTAERIIGIDGSARISGHGDISNPATWWAEYCLATAHLFER